MSEEAQPMKWQDVAEVLCTEQCAQCGDKPCSQLPDALPHCDQCEGMAKAMLAAFDITQKESDQ